MNKKSSRKPLCWCFSQYVFRCGWTRQQTTTYSSFWKTSSQGFFAIYHTSIHFFQWEMFSEALTSINRLRDSTDFETQLYLCNEAFKVWTLTPFNSIQNTPHSKISLKLWGWSMFNSKFQNTPLSIQILLSVARLAHLPPTLLLPRFAGLPPLCPPRNLRPPPWHPSTVEPGAQIFSYGRSVHVGSQWWDTFPGAEWGPTSNHSEESEPFEEKRGGDNFLLRLQVSTSTKILVHPIDQGNKLGAMVT